MISWKVVLVFCAVLSAASHSTLADNLKIASGDWHPYANQTETTEAERLVENLLMLQGHEVDWRYPGFDFSVQHLLAGVADLGFPFFKTGEREQNFIFSEPVFEVRNSVIYRSDNERVAKQVADASAQLRGDIEHQYWADVRFGVVAGYSYKGFFGGEAPASSAVYLNERDAMMALLDGDIDFLPIETRVWQSLALRYFPNRLYKITEVDELAWDESVHLMAPKSEAGESLITHFNEHLADYQQRNTDIDFDVDMSSLAEALGQGTVQLRATQMQPLIKGYTSSAPIDDTLADLATGRVNSPVIVIPEGASALVLDWSDSYFGLKASASTLSVLKGRTRVLLVNGPHVGQTVFVENAHIEIK